MSKPFRISDEALRAAVAASLTMSDLTRNLGYCTGRSNRAMLKRRIKQLGIDGSHLEKHKWRRGIPRVGSNRTVPLEKVLVSGRRCDSHNLKERLIRLNMFERKCQHCGLSDWCGQKIPLTLDHIDGDNINNKIENLRILCENCHALTPTWRGRKRTFNRLKAEASAEATEPDPANSGE